MDETDRIILLMLDLGRDTFVRNFLRRTGHTVDITFECDDQDILKGVIEL